MNSKTLDAVEKANAWVISKVNCCLSKHVSQKIRNYKRYICMRADGHFLTLMMANSRKHLV